MPFSPKALDYEDRLASHPLGKDPEVTFWLVGDRVPKKITHPHKFVAINHQTPLQECLMELGVNRMKHLLSLDPRRISFRLNLLQKLMRWENIQSGDCREIFSGITGPTNFFFTEKYIESIYKNQCIDNAIAACAQNGVNEGLFQIIRLYIDEMFMNSFYNAPVGPSGEYLYRSTQRSVPVKMPKGAAVRIELSLSEDSLGIYCTDPYGSLDPMKLIEHMVQNNNDNNQIRASTHTAGAGVGCQMMMQNASEFGVLVDPGRFTLFFGILNLKTRQRTLGTEHKSLHFLARGDYV